MNLDKAGKSYWDQVWTNSGLPKAIDPRASGLRDYVNRRFHQYFNVAFSHINAQSRRRLLEVGCAGSAWLPYFAKEFDFEIHGIDYSEIGCQQALQMLSREGVTGKIVCADLFSPPEQMLEAFDVVFSFGVVEHFRDTTACVSALSRFLRPDGLIVTIIPNMVGVVGLFQRIVNRPVFDLHVPLDDDLLRKAHESSGLTVLSCEYFLFMNFGVCNLNAVPAQSIRWLTKKLLLAFLSRMSMLVWSVEGKLGPLQASRVMSPYINCLAGKPSAFT